VRLTLKAIVQDTYGGPEVLELRDIDQPVPRDDEVFHIGS
jgi:NADPH:quinone reductase-like Zn-dependent oxidoreductase